MTTTNETPAAKADRYVKAAQAALQALQGTPDADFDHPLRREVEFAVDAAHVYSRIAVAQAIERSFPALPGVEFTAGGIPLPDDEIGRRLVQHIAEHARATGDRPEFLRG